MKHIVVIVALVAAGIVPLMAQDRLPRRMARPRPLAGWRW